MVPNLVWDLVGDSETGGVGPLLDEDAFESVSLGIRSGGVAGISFPVSMQSLTQGFSDDPLLLELSLRSPRRLPLSVEGSMPGMR